MSLILLQAPINIPLELAVDTVGVSPINDLGVFVSGIVGAFLVVAGALAFVYLAYGGLKWLMADGDSGKLDEAKQTLTNAIMGLGVTATAWAIFLLINYFLGLGIALGGPGGGSGGPGGGGGSGVGDCAGGISIDQKASDGGAGGYCNGGAARVQCVAAGVGPSNFNYPHYEPVCCLGGSPNLSYQFLQGGMCN